MHALQKVALPSAALPAKYAKQSTANTYEGVGTNITQPHLEINAQYRSYRISSQCSKPVTQMPWQTGLTKPA